MKHKQVQYISEYAFFVYLYCIVFRFIFICLLNSLSDCIIPLFSLDNLKNVYIYICFIIKV